MRYLVFAFVVLLALPVAAQDLNKGLEAFESKDYAMALRELRPLAEQGDADAQYNFGVMYQDGRGVPQDYIESAKWIRKAAEGGHARAQYSLGTIYRSAIYAAVAGLTQDHAEAAKWFRKAAEQGYYLAQSTLGTLYVGGASVPQDYVQAHMWFSLAAAQGDKIAAESRDIIAGKISTTDVSKAQRLAREWMAKRK